MGGRGEPDGVTITIARRGKIAGRGLIPPDGLKLWLDASRITGKVDGDSITTWADISGLGTDMSEATNPPTYKTAIINSLPVVRFDGTNDKLENNITDIDSDYSVFVVLKTSNPAQASGAGAFASHNTNASAKAFGITLDGASNWRLAARNNASTADATATIGAADTNPTILTTTGDASGGKTYKDGVAGGTFADPTQGRLRFLRLGINRTTTFGAFDIAEVILYYRVLTASERASVLSYLGAKYGIAV